MTGQAVAKPFRAYTTKDIDVLPQLQSLTEEQRLNIKAVSSVFPFRVNNYVVEELIDWDNIPNDPIYQLTFPQPGMLTDDQLETMLGMIKAERSKQEILTAARQIQVDLNPHPAGQMELNVPMEAGSPVQGAQHKYRETVLFFPSQGQTCHAYCTYCFRWAQFVGIDDLKFASKESDQLVDYLRRHPEVTDVLFTGGDPMIMKTKLLRRYIEPLLNSGLDHLQNIRIGTKAIGYWPYRFTTDRDSDDLMKLFEEVSTAGKHLALMAHFSHPRELATTAARDAMKRIQATGAVIRCQAPLIANVNDNAQTWADMWREQVRLGAIPYYMFVERDTGPKHYFEVPLHRALNIYQSAYQQVSGLARTVRGPSMSATPGKVVVDGISEVAGQKVFVLKFIQARQSEWTEQVFFAEFDEKASWLDQLKPAFGESSFFFEESLKQMKDSRRQLLTEKKGILERELIGLRN